MYSGHLTERAEEDDMDERILPFVGDYLDAMGYATYCKSICLQKCARFVVCELFTSCLDICPDLIRNLSQCDGTPSQGGIAQLCLSSQSDASTCNVERSKQLCRCWEEAKALYSHGFGSLGLFPDRAGRSSDRASQFSTFQSQTNARHQRRLSQGFTCLA